MPNTDIECFVRLTASGWVVAANTRIDADGSIVWTVRGRHPDPPFPGIKSEAATRDEAWLGAVEQAKRLGMFDEGQWG